MTTLDLISRTDLQQEIRRLAKEKNAVILAHNYQVTEVQDIADVVGDSLGLSIKAQETDADMFGVRRQDLIQLRLRAVGLAVVHEDQLIGEPQWTHDRVQFIVQRDDIVDFVIQGHEDGEIDHFGRCQRGDPRHLGTSIAAGLDRSGFRADVSS